MRRRVCCAGPSRFLLFEMERVNSPLLAFVEAFGTRNQELFLSDQMLGTWDVRSDVLGNLRLTGADATGANLAASDQGPVAVRVEQDTYVTGIWIQEPRTTVIDTILVRNAFILRNQGGTFTQLMALRLELLGNMTQIGNGLDGERIWPLSGLPWGFLLRAGDVISALLLNRGAAATTAGAVIAYRGFSGPPF